MAKKYPEGGCAPSWRLLHMTRRAGPQVPRHGETPCPKQHGCFVEPGTAKVWLEGGTLNRNQKRAFLWRRPCVKKQGHLSVRNQAQTVSRHSWPWVSSLYPSGSVLSRAAKVRGLREMVCELSPLLAWEYLFHISSLEWIFLSARVNSLKMLF